jgi:hypothetical protein
MAPTPPMMNRRTWAAGQKKSGTYQRYVNWYRARSASQGTTDFRSHDPYLTPIPRNRVRAMAAQDVNAVIGPLIRQTATQIGQRTKAGQAAIQGYTDTYQKRLGQIGGDLNKAYNAYVLQQQGIDDELRGTLAQRGQQLGQQVTPFTARPGDDLGVSKLGAGAGLQSLGYGHSTLARLLGQSAAEKAYATELPGVGILEGARNTRLLQAKGSQDLADQLSQIRSQVPQMVSDTYQSYLDREMTRALALEATGRDLTTTAMGEAGATTRAKLAGKGGSTASNVLAAQQASRELYNQLTQQTLDIYAPQDPITKKRTELGQWNAHFNQIRQLVKGYYPDKKPAFIDAYALRLLQAIGVKVPGGGGKGRKGGRGGASTAATASAGGRRRGSAGPPAPPRPGRGKKKRKRRPTYGGDPTANAFANAYARRGY